MAHEIFERFFAASLLILGTTWTLLGTTWALNTGQSRSLVVTTGQPKPLSLFGLWMKIYGAGDENRTRVLSLGNWGAEHSPIRIRSMRGPTSYSSTRITNAKRFKRRLPRIGPPTEHILWTIYST